jgi:hypothetical protein
LRSVGLNECSHFRWSSMCRLASDAFSAVIAPARSLAFTAPPAVPRARAHSLLELIRIRAVVASSVVVTVWWSLRRECETKPKGAQLLASSVAVHRRMDVDRGGHSRTKGPFSSAFHAARRIGGRSRNSSGRRSL